MSNRSVVFFMLVAFSPSVTKAQHVPNGEQLCQSVRALLQASYHDFDPVKRHVTHHSDGATDWVPSINIAGSADCDGQSDPEFSSSVSCTMGESQSAEEAANAYQIMVSRMRPCLDSSFVFSEKEGGKSSKHSTPIKEATFEVKGKGDSPDGPAVRISMAQFHRTHSGYELVVWIDGKDKE